MILESSVSKTRNFKTDLSVLGLSNAPLFHYVTKGMLVCKYQVNVPQCRFLDYKLCLVRFELGSVKWKVFTLYSNIFSFALYKLLVWANE